jgi:hypothetical protein
MSIVNVSVLTSEHDAVVTDVFVIHVDGKQLLLSLPVVVSETDEIVNGEPFLYITNCEPLLSPPPGSQLTNSCPKLNDKLSVVPSGISSVFSEYEFR